HTASDSDQYIVSGWIGRYLDTYGKHPYNAIEIDDQLSLAMKGNTKNGIATKDPKILYRSSQDPFFKKVLRAYNEQQKDNLEYLYSTMIDAESSAKYIFETSRTFHTHQEYPQNPLANQLRTAAKFINAGLDTRVYYTSLNGFDTHAGQLNKQNRLLGIYAESMEAFINDLKQNNTFKDTLIMTFSEFGRRVAQNAANGTDHGTANNVFLIGENLKQKGIYNEAPDLSNLDGNGDLKHSIDFRSIYATILNKWLLTNDQVILNQQKFPLLDLI
ncbi:MAG: twin-arginine translocation pathway signal, partial [Flavobacteriia bacterium]